MASRTPLYDWHRSAGARLIEFGGWEMPLLYTGIVEEHVTVRKSVGLFDVSHMGKIFVEGPACHAFLDSLSANEIARTPGRARYTHLLRDDGTIIDDVIITCLAPDRFFLVCNAGPRAEVMSWLKSHMKPGVSLADRTLELFCLAVQGPRAPELLQRFTSVDLSRVKPFAGTVLDFVTPAPWGAAPRAVPPEIEGWGRVQATDPSTPRRGEPTASGGRTAFLATRTGYTGEPGFELFPAAAEGLGVWESVLKSGEDLGIRPIGLGARDTLRLEKGYLLSGQDFDGHQTPLEVNSAWLVKWDHPFIGRDALERQRARDQYRRLVSLHMEDRGIPRHGYRVLFQAKDVGLVTSGTMSPSLRVGIALASVDKSASAIGTTLDVDIRGTLHPASVVKLPFL
ncbi:MAG: glycine cleavage system protein T [Methanobacteriota archaeon]|nr:MAG: glycine cleavage system protein T [Euryarchaeota archaeon]